MMVVTVRVLVVVLLLLLMEGLLKIIIKVEASSRSHQRVSLSPRKPVNYFYYLRKITITYIWIRTEKRKTSEQVNERFT